MPFCDLSDVEVGQFFDHASIDATLKSRIQTRAYFHYLEECRRAAPVTSGPLHHWKQAVRDELNHRISVRAYHLWKQECHRVGGLVHKNDQWHWFEAEAIERAELHQLSLIPPNGGN